MAYQSLYRRLRPLTFAQITGQDHVTRDIKPCAFPGTAGSRLSFLWAAGDGEDYNGQDSSPRSQL